MRMKIFYMLWMLFMLFLNLEVKVGCKINGCNVWNIVFYKMFFFFVCDKYDICYVCVRIMFIFIIYDIVKIFV